MIRRGVGVDDPHLFAERLERERHGQLRPDRVAVGPGVGRQEEACAAKDFVPDLIQTPKRQLGLRRHAVHSHWDRGRRRRDRLCQVREATAPPWVRC